MFCLKKHFDCLILKRNLMQDTPNLTRLGNLLIDLNAVRAVLPVQGDTPEDCHGFDIMTSGGALKVYDNETTEAVRRQFYGNVSHS